MVRALVVAVVLSICLVLAPAAQAADRVVQQFGPGDPGIGDPYFPLDGNGGYDVKSYALDLAYEPSTDVLTGEAIIRARATQDLSSFNLDFEGMEVLAVTVDGRPATWAREGGELTVTPRRGLSEGRRFRVVVSYEGVPRTLGDPDIGEGFVHTDDGALIAGQPDSAATWFPVNDHPLDKASYTFRITVPESLEAIANGKLRRKVDRGERTTWVWVAREPMASYLTTATIGEFDLRAYKADGIAYWDAIDPDLFDPVEPRTGTRLAIAGRGPSAYKRLARTLSVPAGGAELSFWVTRNSELRWDYMFVEARPVGTDEWTTLPDANGHTSPSTGSSCPYWLGLHPFLTHYQTDNGDGTCAPTGTTGTWSAASGASDGYEQWRIDLARYAGRDVELSISYVTDDVYEYPGIFVDDVEVTGASGSTSFEDDGDTLDGWTVPGPPEGTAPNSEDWVVGTAEDTPPTLGEIAAASLQRQPEIIEFLSGVFGPYPFSAAGGIVDDTDLGFALETQTRPVYSPGFFVTPETGDSVVVHELAHQWAGDSLALAAWQHIWLNEGFASYAEWLWSEREGRATAQQLFDAYAGISAGNPFWTVKIGDPGPENLFDTAVYDRGAMTLHALRTTIGDEDFFSLLRRWMVSRKGDNVTTNEFIALAERISGRQLDEFFTTWLFTAAKPEGIEPPARRSGARGKAKSRALTKGLRGKR